MALNPAMRAKIERLTAEQHDYTAASYEVAAQICELEGETDRLLHYRGLIASYRSLAENARVVARALLARIDADQEPKS